MRRLLMVVLSIIIFICPTISFADDCGDVDVSGDINVADLVYLVDYLFKGGAPPNCGTVTDYDGNVYQTVTIGTQVWMTENLKVTHYRNGDPIVNVTEDTVWWWLTTGAYCNYDNDEGHVAVYGRLYNWYAVGDSRGLAPEGWHVPSDEEWKQLEMSLGMSQADADYYDFRGTDECGKLKEIGITHWNIPNEGATNESGFSAIPSGIRNLESTFLNMGNNVFYWLATEHKSIDDKAYDRILYYDRSDIRRTTNMKLFGFSVRCIKD